MILDAHLYFYAEALYIYVRLEVAAVLMLPAKAVDHVSSPTIKRYPGLPHAAADRNLCRERKSHDQRYC